MRLGLFAVPQSFPQDIESAPQIANLGWPFPPQNNLIHLLNADFPAEIQDFMPNAQRQADFTKGNETVVIQAPDSIDPLLPLPVIVVALRRLPVIKPA